MRCLSSRAILLHRIRTVLALIRDLLYALLSECIRFAVAAELADRDVCLVLKLDALGDQIIWLSSGARNISEFCRKNYRETVFLTRLEHEKFYAALQLFDQVWALDAHRFRHSLPYRLHWLARLRRHGFSHVLQLRLAREFLQEDLIVSALRVGDSRTPAGDLRNMRNWQQRFSRRWYAKTYPVASAMSARHELERNRSLALAITGDVAVLAHRIEVPVSAQPLPASKYYVLAPGAGWAPRRWPPRNFVCVVRLLQEHFPDYRCILAGSASEAELCRDIADQTGAQDHCGKSTIMDLMQLIQSAAFVIANESATAHIAAYLQVPSIALLGGGHYGWFMPYPSTWAGLTPPRVAVHTMDCFGCNWRCPYLSAAQATVPCIDNIAPQQVIRLAGEVIGGPECQPAFAAPPG